MPYLPDYLLPARKSSYLPVTIDTQLSSACLSWQERPETNSQK